VTYGRFSADFGVKIRGIDPAALTRPVIDITNRSSPTAVPAYTDGGTLTTAYIKEKVPGAVVDPGQLRCEIIYDPDVSVPIYQPPEVITVTFAKSTQTVTTAAAWSFNGFVSEYPMPAPWEEDPVGTMVIELAAEGTNAMQFTAEA
jgi:hypothetical protein